ncbi:MAG: fructose-6-phosphate aldolase [Bacteriovoracia bacterium]
MKIFIDSAELKEIEAAAKTGLIDGVTTNPSLVAKSGMKFEDLLRRICELVDGPISAEVTALDAPGMIEQGRKLAAMNRNIVVKIPLTFEGLKAAKIFAKEGIRTNVTLCFSPVQAMLAAKAGATYISPFVGRLDDIGHVGMDLIRDIKTCYDHYGYSTQILVASVRHVEHMVESIRIGAHVATIPYKVFSQLLDHPLTEIGLAKFMKDWETAKK